MRGLILAFLFSTIFAQSPPTPPAVIHIPSQESIGFAARPIALNPVAINIVLDIESGTRSDPANPLTVCLGQGGQQCAAGCDPAFLQIPTNVYNAVTRALTFNVGPWPVPTPGSWAVPTTDYNGPRRLCAFRNVGPTFQLRDNNLRDYFVQASWDCSPGNQPVPANNGQEGCGTIQRRNAALNNVMGNQLNAYLGQTQCCLLAANSGQQAFPQVVGVCINPNQQTCCGNQRVTAPEQCCSATTAVLPTVLDVATPCPCGGPVPANSPQGFVAQTCPGTQQCCRRTKYQFNAGSWGRCYDANTHLCCDTGDVFDPAVQQCCPINGLQSSNVPCPCGNHADCQGSAFPTADGTPADVRKSMQCCFQTAPPVNEKLTCSVFDNLNPNPTQTLQGNNAPFPAPFNMDPTGTGSVHAQRCRGFCIDVNYQICCNGVACIREYERCCNNTCCNTFVGTCATGYRPGSNGNKWNSREYNIVYEQCSTIEVTTSINVFWIYILPTALLLSTLLGFAIALAFANIAARGRLSLLEKMIIFFAIFALLCACLLFFAPVYKYGIFVVIVALLAIITAAARVRWLNILFIVAVILLLWYVIDPLDGNDFWGVGYRRLPSGKPDPLASGMWHTTGSIWHNISQVNDATNWCVDFYDYFRYDPDLRDEQRLHNPVVTTFGYCSRGWVFALLIMEGFITICLFVLLLLGLLALLLRFRKMAFDPVELEIVNA